MKTIKIIALTALVVFFASCGNKQTANESQNNIPTLSENEQAGSANEIYGTYEGIIPGANSAEISMHLTINSDETFVLTREYQGSKQGSFKDQGKYNFINDNVIELIDKKGVRTYYRVDNGSVILSDPEGNVADADFASQYQLRKI